jgi:hypothetical protein
MRSALRKIGVLLRHISEPRAEGEPVATEE